MQIEAVTLATQVGLALERMHSDSPGSQLSFDFETPISDSCSVESGALALFRAR